MHGWNSDEPRKIAGADDLHVFPFRNDETTYGTLTWIWSMAVDGAFYVRYNGQESKWYRAAARQYAGRILAAGLTKEVTFEVEGPVLNSIRRCLPGGVSRQSVS
jgi:hypothetical protein